MVKTPKLRFIELCSDTTFKYLYKNDKYRPWFNNIIKSKFNIDLNDYTLSDIEFNTGNKKKDYRVDVSLSKGENCVIIEINNSYYTFIDNKSYQYLYRSAGYRYDQGNDYVENKITKLILFNNYKNPKLPEMKTANFKLKEESTGLVIEDIESFEIYLPNFKEVCYHIDNEVDISLSLFSCTSYEEMRNKTNNPKDIEIIEELERLAMDENFLLSYDHEQVRKKVENSIRIEGFNEGINQEKIEIAKNMLSMNLTLEQISQATNLSLEEIENIKRTM